MITRWLTQETADLSWFRPSIVDRVITLCPVGLSLCVGLIVKSCVVQLSSLPQEPCPPLYSQEATVAVIFSGAPDCRSKHQEKLALWTIMTAEPATPRYLNWSEYPIQFSREGQWTSVGNVGHYPLVLDPTITGITVTKVLIDGGAGLNIIFSETLGRWDYNSPG